MIEAEDLRQAVTVTYNFVYDGQIKYTQNSAVMLGEAFPDYTVKFPAGVTAAEKPAGTVAADNLTQEIALSVSLPFTVSALTDGKFGEGMAWYYLTLRSKDVTYDAKASGKALTGNVAEKNEFNLFAFTGNPFDGYQIYSYAAGPDKVAYAKEKDKNNGCVYFTEGTADCNTWLMYANTESGYQFRLNGYDNAWLNDVTSAFGIWNHTYGATDAGSTFVFTAADATTLAEVFEVNYNYTYEGDVKGTQTTLVLDGSEYPAITYVMPYGVVGTKPSGTVEASGTQTIQLVVEKELPFKAAADVNSIDTWYYAQLHMNSDVTSYIQDNGGDGIEWKDRSVDAAEIDSHLWGFAGDVWNGIKVVNKATEKAITSTSGNAKMGDLANATTFVVTESDNNYEECFCLQYPGINSWLNAQGESVKSHTDNDNGSSFLLTEYKEHEVAVSDLQYSTLYLDYAAYIPEGVEVYTVSAIDENGRVVLSAVEGGVLPVGTGVILKNEGGYTFKAAGATGSVGDNMLRGSATDTYVEGDAYVLANGSKGVGLYKAKLNKNEVGADGDTHFKNNANKAYLVVPTEQAGAPMFSFTRGDEEDTTGIELISNDGELVIYDLAGRRVEKMEKGIYIVNGRKVIR